MKQKLWNLNNLLYIALFLALLASLGHVAYAFSTVNGGNWPEAYISAVAIDVGLLALAAGINQRKGKQRSTWPLWVGVILFSVISTYANWLSGVVHVAPLAGQDAPLVLSRARLAVAQASGFGAWLVTLRPVLLSAVLPALVIYLAEIASDNYLVEHSAVSLDEPQARREPPATRDGAPAAPSVQEPQQADPTTDERRRRVLQLLQQGMSQAAIARELSVHRSTIARDIGALNGAVGGRDAGK